ncbi:MAG: ABC transporter permease [Acidimicrobiia bacterium]
MIGGAVAKVRRGNQVAGAFVWMGYMEARAYPMALALAMVSSLAAPVTYYFVAELVDSGPSVGDSYYTFAVIGLSAASAMAGGLSAFGSTLDYSLQQGRFETLLVEPVRWRILPFGLAGWAILVSSFTASTSFVAGLILGIDIRVSALPAALVVAVLGVAAGHAVGIISASVKVLSKRSDPVLGLYMMFAFVLSGVVFPVDLLPLPLKVISYLIPHTYVISALRQLLMDDPSSLPGPSATQAVVLLLVFLVVVYPIGLWLFGRALDYGRKLGVLAGY